MPQFRNRFGYNRTLNGSLEAGFASSNLLLIDSGLEDATHPPMNEGASVASSNQLTRIADWRKQSTLE